MKKWIAMMLFAFITTSAMAGTHQITITPDNTLSSVGLKNWKFRSQKDQIYIVNLTNHPIEMLFYLSGTVIDDKGQLHLTDKVNYWCNAKSNVLYGETTMFCEIEPGLSFSANIKNSDWINGAEGTYDIRES